MSALRIAVDVTPIRTGGECGGAKPFVLELLKGLAVAPRQHEYRLLTLDHNDTAFSSHDAQNVTRWRVDALEPRAVAGMLREAAFDVLFCPMTAPTYAAEGVATASILYDLQHLAYPSFFTQAELANRTAFFGDLVNRADHVVCISEFSRRALVEQLHMAPERTSVVPIAIQDRLPHYEPAEAWRVLGARGLTPCRFAFYPANFWPHKNHRMLLLAFRNFLRDHSDSGLHLVLTGELLGAAGDVRDAVTRMGLDSRVHLLGFVPEAELGALWSTAEFLVFPSLYEGFGIPLTEAMAFGTPILCSGEGSLPEVAGDTAVYFDARNPRTLVEALAWAVSHSDDLRGMAARARGRLAAFSPEVVVERYLDMFDAVAAEASVRRERASRRAEATEPRPEPPAAATGEPRAHFEARRARGVRLMHEGRALLREGQLVRGVSVLGAGVVLAPDVVARLVAVRKVRPLWFKARGRMFGERPVAAETQAWLAHTMLHGDGWAGPTLALEAVVPSGQTAVTISGETDPRHLRGPLELEPFMDGRSLGRQPIGGLRSFAVTWDLGTIQPGQHQLQIVASSFMVPDDYLGNGDYRPISYRLGSVTFSGRPQS